MIINSQTCAHIKCRYNTNILHSTQTQYCEHTLNIIPYRVNTNKVLEKNPQRFKSLKFYKHINFCWWSCRIYVRALYCVAKPLSMLACSMKTNGEVDGPSSAQKRDDEDGIVTSEVLPQELDSCNSLTLSAIFPHKLASKIESALSAWVFYLVSFKCYCCNAQTRWCLNMRLCSSTGSLTFLHVTDNFSQGRFPFQYFGCS